MEIKFSIKIMYILTITVTDFYELNVVHLCLSILVAAAIYCFLPMNLVLNLTTIYMFIMSDKCYPYLLVLEQI